MDNKNDSVNDINYDYYVSNYKINNQCDDLSNNLFLALKNYVYSNFYDIAVYR